MPTARSSTPAPLPGCTPLFDAAALREADRRAAEDFAMPSILLMERAGLATAQAVLEGFPGMRSALVVVGSGNNGGDGMVVARHLAEAGWEVEVMAPGDAPSTPDGPATRTGPCSTSRPSRAVPVSCDAPPVRTTPAGSIPA